MFYLRLSLYVFWAIFSAILAIPIAVFRFGNLANNRAYGLFFSRIGRWILGARVRVEGWEHWEKHQPCVYVVNHQSGADLAILSPVFPKNTVLIGKQELIFIPFWGFMYWAFGNILIKRSDRKNSIDGLKKAMGIMKAKNASVWIFPEGTRNTSTEKLLPFKKGAFYMAQEAQIPLLPMVCSPIGKSISFSNRWIRPAEYVIRILPPIAPPKPADRRDLERAMGECYWAMNQAFQAPSSQPPLHIPSG